MSDWRLAKSLEVLRSQINTRWPARNKDSDGGIAGGEHHIANPNSDHEPWVKDGAMGVVTAFDFTNDPKTGPDAGVLAEALRLSRDPRIKYLISNKRICASYAVHGEEAWSWRPYFGKNDHTHHVHVSVRSEKSFYDALEPWTIEISQPQGGSNV